MASKINKNKVIAAAQKYVQRGQYDRAIREYRKVVEEDPRDVRIWLKIGDLHAKKNATQDAVDTYLKVAEFYSEQGFYLKAVAVYKQILKLNPALVDVNLKLAELYKQLGLLNDAMQQYELVSNHYHQQGRTKDALAAVRQIVDLDPENVASRIKLAELYSKEQMREEAVEEFAKAADFLRASNRIEDFIKVAERLVYHQPDNLPVSKELASLYLRRRDPRRALQKLQLAFKADPRDEHTLGMLAQAFEDLGQVAKTISVLKELAHIHAENGDDTKRRATLERILALAPDDAEARRLLDAVPAGDGAAAAAAPAAGAMPPAEAIQPAAPAASPSPSPAPAPPRAPGAVIAPPPPPPAASAAPGPPPLPPSAAIARASSAPQARHAALQPPPPPAYEPTPSPEILDADQLDFEEVDAYEGSAYDPHRKPTGQAPALMAPETLAPEMLAPESFDEPLQQAATAADELYSSGPQQRYDSQSGYAPDGHDHGSGYEASYQSHPSQAHPGQAHPGQHAPPEYVGYEGEEEDLEDEVARVLTEADVYIKYGLHDKAIDHLRQIFERDPANVEVRLKLRDLHLQLGRFADASTELYALAQGLAQTDRRSAAGYLNEALELDQNNVPARELLGMLESGLQPVVDLPLGPSRTHAGGYREDSGLDEFDENSAINLDAGDIVEEIALEPDQDFGSTAVGGPSMLRNPSPGSSAYRGSGDFSRGSGDFARGSGDFSRGSGEFARGSGELARGSGEFARGSGELSRTPSGELDQLADLAQASSPHGYREDPYGVRESGVLELSGQATDTLGGSMPSQDVIPLPAEQHPSASHARIRQEEEAGSGIEDDLEEADFFIQQHLFAEARSILDDLESRYPGHPLVAAKVADLQESERRADSFNDGTIPGDSQVDLAAELADSLDEPVPPLPGTNEGADYSVEDVFNEFKRGVDNQVSDEDSDTHYDLGIAYREMGLLDDAIAEFKVAMRSREKEVLCHMMIGLCYAEKSMMSEAISQFKTGLYVEGITERETIALYFELGQAYEHLDDLREALYYYEKVGKKDPKFRDVATRIERIRRLSGGGNGAPGGGGSGGAGSSGGGHSARSSRQYHDSDVVELADEHTPATV